MGKKNNKSSRNVLALPGKSFWPLLQKTESETSLLTELQKILKQARTLQPQLKWSEIRKMNREDRARKIEEFFKEISNEELKQHEKAKILKKSLAIGVNEVSRCLEKKELACCLLHGQAKPNMIVSHIVELAKCRMTPIVILNDLKHSLKESLGFSSLAIGFLREVIDNENHEFHQLCSSVIDLSKELVSNTEHTKHIDCETKLSAEIVTQVTEIDIENSDFTAMNIDCLSLHLYRTSTSYRVFHPPDEELYSDKEDDTYDNEVTMISEVVPDISKVRHTSDDDNVEYSVPSKKIKYFKEPNILKVHCNPNKFRKNKKKTRV